MMTLCILSAHASGQVFKGDAILTINGSDVTRMTVNEVAHLIATSRRKVTLHLARPSSEGRDTNAVLDETRVREELLVKEVVLEQDHNGIGITIKGGADLKSPLRVDKIINHSPGLCLCLVLYLYCMSTSIVFQLHQ
jgi:hypothetical protein